MRISDWSSDVCSSDLRSPCRHAAWLSLSAASGKAEGRRAGGRMRRPARRSLTVKARSERFMVWQFSAASLPQPSASSFKSVALLSRSEEHTSELQSLMRISYAVFCLKKKKSVQVYSKEPHAQHHNYINHSTSTTQPNTT